MLKWLLRAVTLLLIVLVVGFLIAGLLPAVEDPVVAEAQWGVGASSVEPSSSGLEREFPPMPVPDGNTPSPDREELGRLLFFDPLLSAENDISCATCHHPDLGFADGRAVAMGAGGRGVGPARSGGKALTRNTPTLWNVGYRQSLFWDGRADSLEAQALTPLAHVDEMGASPDQLAAELRAIPEYVERFDRAFGGGEEAVTIENVAKALAAFQRTLVSRNSAFDRYAAGDANALTPAQRRGLALFRSAATRCFECHAPPTFASETFRVLGVPESPGGPPDPGRSAVGNDAPFGAFRVPSLRNVALTAPYMHNGAFETLEEVVDFYAEGGGRSHGAADVDPFVLGFELDSQERSDLIAFLYALTDESALPEVPTTVPSGLPVVERLENPARAVAESLTAPSGSGVQPSRPPRTIVVQPEESIQAAVDRAQPGDVVEVPYGIYHERVVIDISNLTLRGVPGEGGEWPVLDGRMVLADGVIASGNNVVIERLTMKNYTGNGLLVEGVKGVTIREVRTENTGIYGVYPVQSDGVLIERVIATGARDAGIYVGQSRGIVIRDSEAWGNVIGIEVENSVNVEVYRNYAHGNTVGLFFDLLPQLTSKVGQNYRAYENRLIDNNLENFADEDMIAALLPPGVGLLVLATDEGEIYNNEIHGNATAGIAVFSLGIGFDPDEINVGPTPERNSIHDNRLSNNGYAPAKMVRDLGIGGADILWDGSGWSNRFDQPGASSFPPLLPGSSWPEVARRGYWRLLDFAINRLAG